MKATTISQDASSSQSTDVNSQAAPIEAHLPFVIFPTKAACPAAGGTAELV